MFWSLQVLAGALHAAFLSLNLGPRIKLSGLDILYYTSPFVILLILPAMFLSHEPSVITAFVETDGLGRLILLTGIGCILAVSYSTPHSFSNTT